jgi:hypothetical protein
MAEAVAERGYDLSTKGEPPRQTVCLTRQKSLQSSLNVTGSCRVENLQTLVSNEEGVNGEQADYKENKLNRSSWEIAGN